MFIVDDHPAVRLGLRSLISQEDDFEIVGEAASIGEALEKVRALQPEIAIVDISFEKGRDGLELVQQLSGEVKILVCSYHDERLFAERALAAGARGYIQKSEVLDEVVNALRRIRKGEVYLSQRMSQHLLRMIGHKREDGISLMDLTNRELEVFKLLGIGCETWEVAERLNLSPKTVAKHYENIMAKLNIQSKAKLLYHAVIWTREEQNSA
ncbi:MAG TPA: response regulator transcription factor [Acidobacteriota bacterium]|nr:response regulator transcription factor [Acidobacteriota bacterium]